tara:strand:+ start:3787 stop:5076 length:1290 start_codon:yes stop_codon:yes gene_type:complete
VSKIEDVIRKYKPRGDSYFSILIIGLLLSGLVWALLGELEEVAVASGEVIPQGQVKLIQHLEGGIVTEILVEEGQKVSSGTRLIQLRLGADRVRSSELQLQLNGLRIKRERLQAELDKKQFLLPIKQDSRTQKIIQKEILAFENRKEQVIGKTRILKAKSRQKVLEIRELESRIQGRKNSLSLAKKRLLISKDLEKNKLVTRMEALDLENEYEQLKSEISELKSSLQRAEEAVKEANQRAKTQLLDFNREVSEELGNVEIAIAQTKEQLETAAEIVKQTSLKSPIDGIVKNLRQHTIGGVVQPGEAVMEIVPLRDQLIIETKLAPIDVGYVSVGQEADVKIQTYDFLRYGSLKGYVRNVAAGTSIDSSGAPYFRVEIETEKNFLGKKAGSLPITPGMQADVDIKTGSRSVFDYLVSPLLKLQHAAFRER